jgi:hypothetical protein
MAELNKVVINDTQEGTNMSLEQEAAAIDEKAATQNQGETPILEQTTETQNSGSQENERPEWLDNKFKSPEDLAKAYAELERKQGQEDVQETEVSDNDAINSASEYYAEYGELGSDQYAALAASGISQEMVDTYIQGQESILATEVQQIQAGIGGADNYEAMTQWATSNISNEEIEAYDAIVESGSSDQAKMAVEGMYARYVAANGNQPTLTQGSTTGSAVQPFNSSAQITQAMRDPRYKMDPAYRADVEKRLARSNVI